MVEEIIAAILSSPQIKELIETVAESVAVKAGEAAAVKIFSIIFGKAENSAAFLSQSATVFAQVKSAQTDEEKSNASKALRDLMAASD